MKQNLPILTGLRFIAAFYVFIFHVNLRESLDFLGKPAVFIISQGAVGVNIFFILSGFILFYNYHDRKMNAMEFILKRIAKIYPVYLAGFFICLAVVSLAKIEVIDFSKVLGLNFFMLQSYFPKYSMQWYGSGSWSISTEFFFYLIFPLLMPAILKLKRKKLIIAIFVCYVFSIIPGILFNLKVISFEISYTFPPSRIWEFIIGILIACLCLKYSFTVKSKLIYFLFGISVVTFILVGRLTAGYVILNIAVVPVMAIILINVLTTGKNILSLLGTSIMEYLGKISYSFYIFQIPIMIFLDAKVDFFSNYSGYVSFIILFFINLCGAIVLFHIVERPFHKFLNQRIKKLFSKKNKYNDQIS